MRFNEDSRVKIPAILHLARLGYTYLSLKNLDWDESSNIVPSIFKSSVAAINPGATPQEIENALTQIDIFLDNEDIGKQFYEFFTETSGLKIIDFEDFNRNSFHVVTEFTCKKDDEEFRPDVTLLINGLPLAFIDVKKPNNRDGILAERNRIITRFRNPKFKRFINIAQFMRSLGHTNFNCRCELTVPSVFALTSFVPGSCVSTVAPLSSLPFFAV